jgi:hypothetical protein
MNTQSCMDVNIIASNNDPVNRQTAVNILKGMGYADHEITEIAVSRSTAYDANTCGAGGVADAPASAAFVYIGRS